MERNKTETNIIDTKEQSGQKLVMVDKGYKLLNDKRQKASSTRML